MPIFYKFDRKGTKNIRFNKIYTTFSIHFNKLNQIICIYQKNILPLQAGMEIKNFVF